MGFSVTVFEAQEVAGGMLVLGVPEYRLPRETVQAEIKAIESLGVEILRNRRLGRDFTLSDLRQQGYEAVFLGIGAHKSR
jgi:NADH-quinone oxidoreductase subunit F